MRSLFLWGQQKAKKKNQKLCDLCDSAVNSFFKDPFRVNIKPPFLGVVIDWLDLREHQRKMVLQSHQNAKYKTPTD